MKECMQPKSLFLFHSLTWKRQSQKMSLMFFSAVFGVTSDRKNRRLSSLGSWTMILIIPIRQ